jgi:hypothetical protein
MAKFDMGWNTLRDQTFDNQKRLGVIPQRTIVDGIGQKPMEGVSMA